MPVIAPQDPYVLLENSLGTNKRARSYLFTAPKRIIRCDDGAELSAALGEIEDALAAGYYAAGWVAYEAGYWLEPKLAPLRGRNPAPEPHLWFGIFDAPQIFTPPELEAFWQNRRDGRQAYAVEQPRFSLSEDAYLARVKTIQDYLAAGDIYQANFTFQCLFDFDGNVESFHRALRESQRVPYGAVLATEAETILSYSPELFLKKRGRRLTARPMKGTAPRGLTYGQDQAHRRQLRADPKSRAENLMIVDLLRNDLGRLADTGSVTVKDLYKVEAYRTVLQMTSTVEARVDKNLTVSRLFRALFPCGSVTGAPKIRAMEIIAELEPMARGVYTGAIGMIAPGGDFTFSVPIRTLRLDNAGRGVMGIGSGIVADSDPAAEWDECLLKGQFFARPQASFELIETMRAEDGRIALLERHLKRLKRSARYFGFRFAEADIRARIDSLLEGEACAGLWRVRLILSRGGALVLSAIPHKDPPADGSLTITLARMHPSPDDPFLRHKTTERGLYNQTLAEAQQAGHFDVVFINRAGEITEGARTNIVIEKAGVRYTPPVESGLLPGVYRADLVDRGDVREAVLSEADLRAAERIFVTNAVIGMVPVRLSAAEDRIRS